jgi:hypothetical protein
MTEVQGKPDPDDLPASALLEEEDDDEDDEFEFHDLDDEDLRVPGIGLLATISSPLALGITALTLAALSLLGFFSTYLLTSAITARDTQATALYSQRVTTALELALGLIALVFAFWAFAKATSEPDAAIRRVPQALAGAAFVLSILSLIQSLASLLILAGAHVQSVTGG